MRRFPISGLLMLLPAFALVFLVGCPPPATNKDKDKDKVAVAADAGKDKDKTTDKGKGGAAVEITTETDGTVKGVVKFDGVPPEPKPLKAIGENKDAPMCMKGGGNHIVEQTWLVKKDGAVANVVISLAAPTGKKFKITDALKKPFEQTAFMDQPFCAYTPHVMAIYADFQPFVVKNSATLTHNVNFSGGKFTAFGKNLPPAEATEAKKFERENNPINIACSAHTFMTAKLLTFDHPYFAVTNEDGLFEIKNAPIGEELIVYMWHESMDKKAEVQKVTLKKGDNDLSLKISAK